MVKKTRKARAKSKAAKKRKYTCDTCGIVLSVDEACSCDPCDIICCGQDMRAVVC